MTLQVIANMLNIINIIHFARGFVKEGYVYCSFSVYNSLGSPDMNQFDDNVQFYIREAASYPVLTREEEIGLFKRLEGGDSSAFDEVVKHNLRFVIKIAIHYKNRGVPLSDLIQEGNVGLLEVINKYNYRKGYRFSTYAAFWIRQAIQLALRRNGFLITLPIRKARLVERIGETISTFIKENGRAPTEEELARLMNIKEELVGKLLKLGESVLSLDDNNDDETTSLFEKIPDREVRSPLEYCMETQARVKIAAMLKCLTEKERRIVKLRYGFEHGKMLSLRKTSRLVGLSQEGVRRIERKALAKLRRPIFREKLAALL